MNAHFAADVRIVDADGRRVIAAQTFTADAPVTDKSSSIATQALAHAARDAAVRIGVFAADSIVAAKAQVAAAAAAQEAAETQTAAPSAPPSVHHSVHRSSRVRRR